MDIVPNTDGSWGNDRLDLRALMRHAGTVPDSLVDPLKHPRRGLLFVLASPSGTGKTSMAKRILAEDPSITLSVSATTRAPRPGEVDGVDYHFVDDAAFDQLVADHALIEWAHVFGKRYGTPRGPVRDLLDQGRDVLFDIDWQGTQQLKARDSKDVVSVYILPPSLTELERRLRARATDSEEVIVDRMARSANEVSHWGEYDYVLINDDFDTCLSQLRAILKAERLRRSRRKAHLAEFVRDMLAGGA